MLLSKSVRITPSLVGACAARFSGQSAVASVEQCRNLTFTNALYINGMTDYARKRSDSISFKAIAPVALTTVRFYADDTKRQQQTTTAPASLPDREQVERFLFRLLALIWDISVWAYVNAKKAIETHIVGNESVQFYWKRMHERMAKAKKEW